MGPHAEHFNDAFVFHDLIDQTMLDINAAGVRAAQIAEKFLERRRFPEGVFSENVEELFRFGPEARGTETASVFLGLRGEDDLPRCHQPGSFSHWSVGVAIPSMIDSRMPGTDRRCKVSCMEFQSSSPTRTAFERGPVMRTGS